jgi:2-phospho-L-lactate/phosphoenolpyruvate guanylyltransferase
VIVVAVPVKDLINAKQRLTAVLSPPERAALARSMLRDVLRTLTAASLDAVWVVTGDAEATALARDFGCAVVGEPENQGHTAAVARAQAAAIAAGAGTFLTVPGDVPCATPDEIDALVVSVQDARRPAAAFTPSRSGLGTNGVALAPADAMTLRFGEPSFENHLGAARRGGLAPRVVPLRGLGLDIDDPDDLRALLAEGHATESARLLSGWPIARRLARRDIESSPSGRREVGGRSDARSPQR